MQECDVIVEHAFEQLAVEGAVQPDWEASQRCIRLACCILLQQEAACPGTQSTASMSMAGDAYSKLCQAGQALC